MGIKRFGLPGFTKSIYDYRDEVQDEVRRIVAETCYLLQAEARNRAPVDTGFLRSSITVEIYNNGFSGRVSIGSDYAVFILFGTGIYAKKNNGNKKGWTYFNHKANEFVFTRGMKPVDFWFEPLDIAEHYYRSELRKIFN